MSLGVDEETASGDACQIEHVLSDKTFEALKESGNSNIKKNVIITPVLNF